MLFPTVLMFCWTAASIDRIIGVFVPGGISWHLFDYVIVVTGSLQGFLNALLYGTTVAVREAIIDEVYGVVSRMRADLKIWRRTKNSSMKRRGEEYSTTSFGKSLASDDLSMEDDEGDIAVHKNAKLAAFALKKARGKKKYKTLTSVRVGSVGSVEEAEVEEVEEPHRSVSDEWDERRTFS